MEINGSGALVAGGERGNFYDNFRCQGSSVAV